MDMGFGTQGIPISEPGILNNVNYEANKSCCCGIVHLDYEAKW
jgi:hypothetical protein